MKVSTLIEAFYVMYSLSIHFYVGYIESDYYTEQCWLMQCYACG